MTAAVDERVLIVARSRRDADLTGDVLRKEGFRTRICADSDELRSEVARGAGVVVLGEEALDETTTRQFRRTLEDQPFWSDLPLIVFATERAAVGGLIQALGSVGNVMVLERPVRVPTLVSAAHAGVRARRRQYEVRDLVSQLKSSDRKKDEFLAMLGHELRNPLGAIRNAVAVLSHPEVSDDGRGLARDQIGRQVGRLARMVDDLLNLARVTQGKISLQRETLAVGDAVRTACESFRASGDAGECPIEIVTPDEPAWIRADPVRFEQILHNLLHNAVKYCDRPAPIEVCASARDGEVVVEVRDRGVGIPPDALEAIFDPFIQAEHTLARSKGGLGLGLPFVKRLMELHGGSVRAQSEGTGHGSTFRLTFPSAVGPSSARPAPVATLEAVPLDGTAVLVVEDQRDSRESLRELLDLWGYRVETANDGAQALARLQSGSYRIALVDIGLPEIDGYEVARRIRADFGDDVRLIAMTGYGQVEDRRRALEAGFDRHLVKPVEPRRLSRLLAEMLETDASGSR